MDCAVNWEYKTLINELTQGIEHTKQLRAHFSSVDSTIQNQELLLQKILSSYEQSLLILKCSVGGSMVQSSSAMMPTCGVIESSVVSVDGSPKSDDKKRSFQDHHELIDISKKRKLQPTWTEQVKVSPKSGFEGPTDDGYSWRKYGQKDIFGAKYPRSYYRCTYRHMQNCWAKKQVQRSDDDPTVFDVTYRGSHSCHHATYYVQQSTSPEKREFKKEAVYQNRQNYSTQALMSLRANLRVDTNDLDKNEQAACHFSFPPTFSSGLTDENHRRFQISHVDENLIGSGYSASFVSPTTPESNYFSVSGSSQMNGYGMIHNLNHSESDLTDIFSANTSTTSSPIVGDFSLDNLELDTNFPFNNPNFFS